jgi:hypothetical protein
MNEPCGSPEQIADALEQMKPVVGEQGDEEYYLVPIGISVWKVIIESLRAKSMPPKQPPK